MENQELNKALKQFKVDIFKYKCPKTRTVLLKYVENALESLHYAVYYKEVSQEQAVKDAKNMFASALDLIKTANIIKR